MLGRVVRLAAATLVVAAVGLAVPGSAQAGTCSSASGVSVVVDFHQLGGGAQSVCDAGGVGETADVQFTESGYTLSYVTGEPFVCQVDQKPDRTCPRTPPADAYWSLWWSNGKSGTWSYASTGVKSLRVPEGGYVALSWQGQSSQVKPRVAPTAHSTSSPSPSASSRPPAPTNSPTHPASNGPVAPSSSDSTSGPGDADSTGAGGPKESHRSKGGTNRRQHTGKTPDASPDASATGHAQGPLTGVATGGDDGSGSSGGLPGWVAPLAIVALFAGAGVFVVVRRKSSGGV